MYLCTLEPLNHNQGSQNKIQPLVPKMEIGGYLELSKPLYLIDLGIATSP